MPRSALFIAFVGFLASSAFAAPPTTQPQNASDLFKISDFDLHVRPMLPQEQKAIDRPVQDWRSFNYNGHTVWNRPAIFNRTYNAVRDKTTGQYFFYRDFANTVKVNPQSLETLNPTEKK